MGTAEASLQLPDLRMHVANRRTQLKRVGCLQSLSASHAASVHPTHAAKALEWGSAACYAQQLGALGALSGLTPIKLMTLGLLRD